MLDLIEEEQMKQEMESLRAENAKLRAALGVFVVFPNDPPKPAPRESEFGDSGRAWLEFINEWTHWSNEQHAPEALGLPFIKAAKQ